MKSSYLMANILGLTSMFQDGDMVKLPTKKGSIKNKLNKGAYTKGKRSRSLKSRSNRQKAKR